MAPKRTLVDVVDPVDLMEQSRPSMGQTRPSMSFGPSSFGVAPKRTLVDVIDPVDPVDLVEDVAVFDLLMGRFRPSMGHRRRSSTLRDFDPVDEVRILDAVEEV